MSDTIELSTINYFVLDKQYLAGNPEEEELTDIVRDVGGLHASLATTPYLSLAARMPDFEQDLLDAFLYDQPALAKIRCMRKTIFVQTVDFLPIVYAATATQVIKASEHFMSYRGVSNQQYAQLADQILKLVERSPMTAVELKEALQVDLDLSAVLYYLCDQGVLVRAAPRHGWKDQHHCYASFARVFPKLDLNGIEEREAILLLVRQYLASFGPASEDDLVWWTGLGRIRIRAALRALADDIVEIYSPETNQYLLLLANELDRLRSTRPGRGPVVSMLPALDNYLMGYTERQRFLDPALADRIVDNSGNITNTILVNGRIMGIWDFGGNDEPELKIHLFEYLQPPAGDLVANLARRLGQILAGREIHVRQCEQMTPLTKQSAGSFQAPLKNC